jgi:hypothetical protein
VGEVERVVNATEADALNAAVTRMQKFRAANPQAIVGYPTETESGLWELSLPGEATRAYESLGVMLDDTGAVGEGRDRRVSEPIPPVSSRPGPSGAAPP